MTGTAMTEEDEFKEIYKLDVISIPTNKPVIRDHNDQVYSSEKGKYSALLIKLSSAMTGQPSCRVPFQSKIQLISAMLKRKGVARGPQCYSTQRKLKSLHRQNTVPLQSLRTWRTWYRYYAWR